MSDVIYPTNLEMKGPWLIDSAQLLALDKIADEVLSADLAVGASAGSSHQSRPIVGSKSLVIFLPGDKEFKISSFKEALADIKAAHETAIGFEYKITARSTTAVLRLAVPKDDRKVSLWSDEDDAKEMALRVNPKDSAEGQRLFGELNSWISDVRPKRWQQWWLGWRGFARLVLVLWMIVGLGGLFSSSPPSLKEQYKQDARKLLKEGINAGNQQRAIELILAMESDYVPPDVKPVRGQLSSTFLLGAFILLGLSCIPRISIGIWKGRDKLVLWRRWIQFASGTIPTLLVARYLYPQVFRAIDTAMSSLAR